MLVFYSLKTIAVKDYMHAFPFLHLKLFYFARLSPAKSEQPVNVYVIILQVGVIKDWRNE